MFRSDARNQLTRRRFLQWSQTAMAALGALPLLGSSSEAFGEATTKAASAGVDYYAKLNVKKIINAKGTFTYLTAAVMPPEVQRAVAEAALHPVHLKELQTNAGEYIAKKLRCEGALVSCGASSALTLATAACVQDANQCTPMDIPQKIGSSEFPKNEVIVQKAHRYEYDHAMTLCGIKIIEVVSLDDYKRAFTPNTVMTNFFNAARGGEISREDWLAVAHQHNVPCHIDAAADMPPIENLWKYTGMGFDLVCFSGGKGIRGPQNAGLLLGKKKLIDIAALNNNPNQCVGRGMKVAKEQIVGMVAAVDWILEQTDDAMEKEFNRREDVVWRMVKDIPTITSTRVTEPIANHVPILMLTYDPAVVGITPKEVMAKLEAQNPSVVLASADENTLGVSTWMLQPGEEVIVGRELRKVLKSAKA
ncbi:MAG TPA: selenocysteine synthase [Edaphobacter sp.]|nr:selenocysteine synthase [Edaphobacter sp.]